MTRLETLKQLRELRRNYAEKHRQVGASFTQQEILDYVDGIAELLLNNLHMSLDLYERAQLKREEDAGAKL